MGKLNRTHASYILEDCGFGIYSWDEDGSTLPLDQSYGTTQTIDSAGNLTTETLKYGLYGLSWFDHYDAGSGHDGGSIVDILDSVSYAVGDRSTTRPTSRLASEKSQGVFPGLASYMRRRVWVKS